MTDDDLRDDFGEELTEALRIRSRATASPNAAVAVERDAVRLRTRRRVLAAALATVLAVAGIGVIVARRTGTTRIHVASPPASTTTTTIPSSFKPLATGVADWTWVSADHGWALVRKHCGATVCMSLHETSNGGTTWATVRTPEVLDANAQYDPGTTCAVRLCVLGVRFATPQIGWLFGPGLLQTTDGGHTWTRPAGPDVIDIEASKGIAVRLTTADWAGCRPGCTYRIERERVGTAAWKPVSRPVFEFPSLIIQGTDAYMVSVPNLAGAGEGELRRSSDAGKTWTPMTDPCAVSGNHLTTSASAAPDGVLVVLCTDRDAPVSPFVRVSLDGGETFGKPHPVPFGTFGVIGAASAQTLAIGFNNSSAKAVLISRDGGATWATTLRPPRDAKDSLTVGWEDAKTARVSFGTNTIWTTRDAGRTWIPHRVTP